MTIPITNVSGAVLVRTPESCFLWIQTLRVLSTMFSVVFWCFNCLREQTPTSVLGVRLSGGRASCARSFQTAKLKASADSEPGAGAERCGHPQAKSLEEWTVTDLAGIVLDGNILRWRRWQLQEQSTKSRFLTTLKNYFAWSCFIHQNCSP
jgi:hypothetical protein